ncbi:MAG TPA: diguanylate cyclase [Bacillota bacterium]|nr:diguanylate cyclase [Peptococcaceae bacterium]HPZ42849.1 diguanylate cyclase [Bacillota bacterium]HQD75604.1 diguanylate cyclase [Bacillota bacterium]HUM58219.1 diguanylate cyclase [Bacillota bacterium]
MDYYLRIDINIFSFLICFIILIDTCIRAEKQFIQSKLFVALIGSNLILLFIDSLQWMLDGRQGQVNVAIYSAASVISYIMAPVPSYLWTLYAVYQIFRDEKRIRKQVYPLLVPVLVNALLALTSLSTGFLFYLDENNIYHRGRGFFLTVAISYLYLAYISLVILWNRRLIEKRFFFPLLLFPMLPVLGSIIQIIYYGSVLLWSGIALSILIIYINIQNYRLHTDYLTGVYNRREADYLLKNKIHNKTPGRSFSGILIDIDNFKEINDRYGHLTGDKVLEISAELIKNSLRKDDFVARYGGDEFLVLLNIKDPSDLKKFVDRIKENLNNYNLHSSFPFRISFSIGYDVYDYSSGMSKDQFLNHIDALMYQNKKMNLALNSLKH